MIDGTYEHISKLMILAYIIFYTRVSYCVLSSTQIILNFVGGQGYPCKSLTEISCKQQELSSIVKEKHN